MIVHQVFAEIFEGEVKNVIVCSNYEMANQLTRYTYGETAFAVDCLQYPCTIGDKYHDESFWRVLADGTEKKIEYVPTQEQQVTTLNAALTDSQLALIEQYESNLTLQQEITNMQLALIDFYEGKVN